MQPGEERERCADLQLGLVLDFAGPGCAAAARFQPERARARDGAVGASNAMRDAVFRDRSLDLYLVTVYSYPKVGSFSYRVTSDDEP